MKKIALALLAVCALATTAKAEVETIAGVAAGYGLGGDVWKQTYFSATGGAVLKTFNDGATKLYSVMRYSGNEVDSHWGAKAIIANKIKSLSGFWVLVDGGALDDAFVNGDGTTEMSATVGAGIAANVSEYLSVAILAEAWRASGDQWNKTLSLGVQSHFFGF